MTWTSNELEQLSQTDELQIATRRSDGTWRRFTPIWVVVAGGEVYVRTWFRRDTGWFASAVAAQQARVRVPGVESDVTVEDVGATDRPLRTSVDAAYEQKYARYGISTLARMTADVAAAATLRLSPDR